MTIEEGGKPDASETPLEPKNEKAKPPAARRRKRRAKKKTKPAPAKRRWEDSFIEALREHRSVQLACESAGIGMTAVYDRRKSSPSFRERWEYELTRRLQVFEKSVWTRIMEGSERVVIVDGEIVHRYRVFETALTIFWLKAHGGPEYRFAEQAEQSANEQERAERIRATMAAMMSTVPAAPPPSTPPPAEVPASA